MKKVIVTAVILIQLAAAVFGDFNRTDLLFSNSLNISLYPEVNYTRNPSVLNGVVTPFMLGGLDLSGAYNYEKMERIDSAIGTAGGTDIDTQLDILPTVGLSWFFPTDEGNAWGVSIDYNSVHQQGSEKLSLYNNASENSTSTMSDNEFDAGVDFYFTLPPGDNTNMGFLLGYNFTYDPTAVRWVNDLSVNPGLNYIEATTDDDYIQDFLHKLHIGYGISMPFNGFDLYAAVNCEGGYEDRARAFTAYDSNGDGYNDKLTLLGDYYLLAADAGGPEDAVSAFVYENYSLRGSVDLSSSLYIPFSEKFALIVDGEYSVIDYRYSHYLMHVIDSTIESDESYFNQYDDSGLGSFSATIGTEFSNSEKRTKLRIGAGYSRFAETHTQDGDTAAGLSLFSSLNPGNYTEMNLGVAPVNNVLSSDGDVDPYRDIVQSVSLFGRYEFAPAQRTVLYLDFGVSGVHAAEIFRAYNLDTRTVWEERNITADLDFVFESVAGVAFPLGDKVTCTVDLKNFGITGDASLLDETHMYDIELESLSTSGDMDYSDEFHFNAELSLGFTAAW